MLPDNWKDTTLGSLTTKPQYGWTSKAATAGRIRYLRTTDLSKGNVNWAEVPFCETEPKHVEQYQVKENDILISRAGSVGVSYKIVKPPINAVFASYLIRFRVINADVGYVHYFLKSQSYWRQITEAAAGIAVQNVNATKLSNIKIPLAPLSEQRQISNKLDELFSHLGELSSKLNRVPELIKGLKEKILNFAVTGKLTEDWRKKNKAREWTFERAADCCIRVQSGGTPKKGRGFSSEGYPFLKVYNIVNQKVDFDFRPQFINSDSHKKVLKKSICHPGDVLMNIVGPPLCKVAIVPGSYSEWNINQAITLFRPKAYLHSKFLYYFFCEGSSVRAVMPETRGVVGQINISLSQCRDFLIPIPSLAEQEEIVKRVDSLFTLSEMFETHYAHIKKSFKDLPEAILKNAFNGKLIARPRKYNERAE